MVTRRKALQISIATFLATIASHSEAQNIKGKRVIVIGAGLAGLAAAKQLQANGADVLVLEAGNRIGGRVQTDMSMGAPFESGAGWIHGPSQENPTKQLANQVNAQTFITDDESLEIFNSSGDALTDSDYERHDELYEYLEKRLYYPKNAGERSVREVLERTDPEILRNPLGRWMLSAYFEFSIGAGIEDISAMNGFESLEYQGEDVIFTNGYRSILAPLAQTLDIRLNVPVSKIRYSDDSVIVGDFSADYTICTVPLGVLKSDKIKFEPPLPNNLLSAIKEVGFGSVTKIAFKFAEPFWNIDTQYFGIMTEPKGRWNYWLNYRTFSDENILLGVSVGKYAPIADRMSKEEMTADALKVLSSVWGQDVSTPLATLTTHWSQNPNFYGAYSYAQAGGSIDQFRAFEKPLLNRLFFAGEHTLFDYCGTTHGALLSGRRAANAILNIQ